MLAAATAGDGTYAGATERALLLAGPGEAPHRIPWERVAAATWADDVLEAVELLADGRPAAHRLHLLEPGRLPEVVRERVQASIVVSVHVPLTGSAGVRISARRRPGSSDVSWMVLLDRGLDPADPLLQARTREALDELRSQTGL